MKIAIVASEAVPFSKTGGLADVAGTLFKEYLAMGLDAFLFVPLYKKTKELFKKDLLNTGTELDIHLGRAVRKCRVYTLKGQGSRVKGQEKVFFIDNDEYFGRDELYGTQLGDYPDNDQRFIFFSKSVIEICIRFGLHVDIMHCNDWQTGLIPLYLKTMYSEAPVFRKTKSIITIHNLGYQGIFPPQTMDVAGLRWDLFNPEGIEFYGKVNFLKAGIAGADIITTVSNTYAQEILMPENGFGLDGLLRKRVDSIFGILNGIDYAEWDPSLDALLPKTYTKTSLAGKAACKTELMKKCHLQGSAATPLLCFIGRLASQKGIDILTDAIPAIIASGANIAIIGKGEERYQTLINSLQNNFSGKLFFYSGFDEATAHLAYAGSDLFLMPSYYEPCGLGQMIAMHYGTLPIARKTGGLADTITEGVTGFLFDEYSAASLIKGIDKALKSYDDKKQWLKMIKNAMSKDFSWSKSALEYIKLYSL